MTDLIQNVQEVYKKWESKSNRGRFKNLHHNRMSGRKQYHERDTSLSNFSKSLSLRKDKRIPCFNTHKFDSLAEFKMAPSVLPMNKARPFVGIPCAKCFPHSKANIEDETAYLLGVHNILHIPYFSLRPFGICYFRNFFKTNPFKSFDISADVIKSERVQDAIQEVLNSSVKEEVSNDLTIEELYKDSRNILKHLKSYISSFCIEIVGFFLHHILKKFFKGIFVHKGQMEILKALHKEDIPFIYLPLNRSYFDNILIAYVLHMHSVKVPFVTVLDEHFIMVLGYILQLLGAIFIRKNVILDEANSDILYDAIVKSYLIKCLQDGRNIELFLEAQRSISGKPQMPNTNLFSAILDSISKGSIEDAYLVPVSISYETTEGGFLTEQLKSKSKEKRNVFSKLWSICKIMHCNFGYVRANFNQPFSVKEFLQTYSKLPAVNDSFENSLSPFSSEDMNNKHNRRKAVAYDLSVHVMYDATTCTSLMSTHLLAFLFITQYRKGGTQQQLQNSMDWLHSEIQRKKCDVGFTGESLPVIKRAVELLGKDLISVETIEMEWTSSDLENNNVKVKIYTPVVKLPHVLELQYYANAVVPIFLKESILVNALYAMIDVDICHFHHCDSRFYVSRDELVQTAIKLSDFLKYEFITMLPCQDIVSTFNDTIDALIDKECLSGANATEGYMQSKKRLHTLSFDAGIDEDWYDEEFTEQQLKIDLKEESISHLEFLRNILSPYIESYWLAACSLLQLIDEVKEESLFIYEMQMIAQEKLYKGLLAYEESFSAETLKNSLRMFWDKQIIEYNCEDNIKTICLSEMYNSFERVNSIIASIEDFRK